jgi:murein DD-endopeptidase MepM/ murein hydrolase activator NlpD
MTLFALGIVVGVAARAPQAQAGTAEPAGSGVARGGDGGGSVFAQRYGELRDLELRVADAADAHLASLPLGVPVHGRLTSSFTPRRFHPILRRVRPHWGIDIAAPYGSPVTAAGDGTVRGVVRNRSYGLVVDITHLDGEYITRYAHLSAVTVHEGQGVRRGDVIGRVGSTGLSTGPHLHYEVFVRGRRRDPALLLDPGAAAELLP